MDAAERQQEEDADRQAVNHMEEILLQARHVAEQARERFQFVTGRSLPSNAPLVLRRTGSRRGENPGLP
jgi:hypothetical protein